MNTQHILNSGGTKFIQSADYQQGQPLGLISCDLYDFRLSDSNAHIMKRIPTLPAGWKLANLSMCDFGMLFGTGAGEINDQHLGMGYFSINFVQDGTTTGINVVAELRDNDGQDKWNAWVTVLVQFFGSVPNTTAPPAPQLG